MKKIKSFRLFESSHSFNRFRDEDEVVSTCKQLLQELDFMDILHQVIRSDKRVEDEYYILIRLSKESEYTTKLALDGNYTMNDISEVTSNIKDYLIDWGFEIISESPSPRSSSYRSSGGNSRILTRYEITFKIEDGALGGK